jgi:ABC-2 type transport system permease protein
VTPAARPQASPTAIRAPRFRGMLASEWLKVSTLRATLPLLAVLAGIAVGVGALLAAAAADGYAALGPADRAAFDPVATALSARPYANVIAAAMAVTLVATEYTSGMVRLTLTATPRRWRLLGAKLLTVVVPALLAGMASAALAAVGLRLEAARGVPTPGMCDAAVLAAIPPRPAQPGRAGLTRPVW